jgi:phage terminase Nu1 subunit (DNA packaging protein)
MKTIPTSHEQTKLTAKNKTELERKIKTMYVNQELVQFIESKIHDKAKKDQVDILHFFKKLVQQVYRSPNPDHKAAFEEEYEAEQLTIAQEQAFYEPLKWINAEIEYLNAQIERLSASEVDQRLDIMQHAKERLSKPWLTKKEVMELFSISIATLKRRISEGMPAHKKGKMIYFYLDEINEYMKPKTAA